MGMLFRFLAIFAVLCATSIQTFAASGDMPSGGNAVSDDYLKAKVLEIANETKQNDGTTIEDVRLQSVGGSHVGEEFNINNTVVPGQPNTVLTVGETVVIERLQKSDGSTQYIYQEAYRLPQMAWLFLLFVILAYLCGGKRGLTSLLGLVVSVLILLWFVLPRIIAGNDPFTVSLIGSVLIACTSLYLAHGFNRRTSIAFLSILITLIAAAFMDFVYVFGAKLFGMGSEESLYVSTGQLQNVDLRGLLLGGIIIGCLGVLDDIATAQTTTIAEVHKANPSLSAKQLRAAGLAVGREHIASLINTLALAYIGASMPVFLLLETNTGYPFWVTLNGQFIAEEVIRTLVGSATLLVAVPVTTWVAAYFFRGRHGNGKNANDAVADLQPVAYHHH